ncbi:MAG: DegT/DnrJ/EryC1/StrS family aminotransferase, partial [Oscillospiraceae bacterium]
SGCTARCLRLRARMGTVDEKAHTSDSACLARLEMELAEHIGRKRCFCCASGTDAMTLALLTREVRTGDAVFVPTLASSSMVDAVVLRGASPVFVDVGSSLVLDVPRLAEAICRVRREGWLRPVGVVGVDLFGVPVDNALVELADQEGLWFLEDIGLSLGASRGGRNAGSLGMLSVCSLLPEGTSGCLYDGGAVFVDDIALSGYLDALCQRERVGMRDSRLLGICSRLDGLAACALLESVTDLPQEVAHRCELSEIYRSALPSALLRPIIPPDVMPSWPRYVVRLPDRMTRDRLRLFLSTKGIPAVPPSVGPLHLDPAFSGLGPGRGAFPYSEVTGPTLLQLPMHTFLTTRQVHQVCDAVSEFFDSSIHRGDTLTAHPSF